MPTLESIIGVAVIAVVGLFLDGTARPMMGGIAGCAVAAFALAQRALGGSSASAAAAPAILKVATVIERSGESSN
jgi:DHA1 family bicyclomycin/chloramphenicol resistance-like MFS transporter